MSLLLLFASITNVLKYTQIKGKLYIKTNSTPIKRTKSDVSVRTEGTARHNMYYNGERKLTGDVYVSYDQIWFFFTILSLCLIVKGCLLVVLLKQFWLYV